MKKIIALLSVLVVASMAQADSVWNMMWYLGGGYALSPINDDLDVLNTTDNFTLTWSLINADTGLALPGAEMTASASSLPSFSSAAGTTSFTSGLELVSGSTGVFRISDVSEPVNVYQYITIDNGTSAYEWKGETYEVTVQDTTKNPPDTPTKLFNGEIIIGGANSTDPDVNARWSPVTSPTPGVPEPATMSLLGIGALALALRRKLRK